MESDGERLRQTIRSLDASCDGGGGCLAARIGQGTSSAALNTHMFLEPCLCRISGLATLPAALALTRIENPW